MKTTLYVALERLIDMQDPSSWKLDRALSASIRSHQAECTVVAVFAPHRFGLIFESREETEDAWRYIYGWLRRKGLSFEDVKPQLAIYEYNWLAAHFDITEKESLIEGGKSAQETWNAALDADGEMDIAACNIDL